MVILLVVKCSFFFKFLNYVLRVCWDVNVIIIFYENVLGFVLIKRLGLFDFDGVW